MQDFADHTTFYGWITIPKNLISYKNFVNNKNLVIKKIAAKAIISFIVKKFIAYMNATREVAQSSISF